MRWTHLPSPGGLYQQHPEILDDFVVIMRIEDKVRQEEEEKAKKQAKPRGKRYRSA